MNLQEVNELINRGFAATGILIVIILLFFIAFKEEIRESLKSKPKSK